MARQPDLDAAELEALLARVLGASTPVSFERVEEGHARPVYRVRRGAGTFYLTAAEDETEDLTGEAHLNGELRRQGARVPEIVHVEACDAALGRSVLIATAIPGQPLAHGWPLVPATSWHDAEAVVREAGRDLALLNQIPVEGFGWVVRNDEPRLQGEFASYGEFVRSYLPNPWPGPLAGAFPAAQLGALETMIDAEQQRDLASGWLAHGDFDVTPIFHADGRYTGMIDFSELRGAEPTFDLGHFHLHDGEVFARLLLPALLEGYGEVVALPDDLPELITRSAILLGLRQLCRWFDERGLPSHDPFVQARVARLGRLLEER